MRRVLCKCGKTCQFGETLAGRGMRCRGCGAVLVVFHRPVAATMTTPAAIDAAVPTRGCGVSVASVQIANSSPAREYQNQGRYRLVREVARGGMGKVGIARDLALNRDVALKQLLEQRADLPGSQRRFLAEAEITGQLEHPGVVPIYGLGRDDLGNPFYAMRLIEGQTLTQAIDSYHKSPRPADLRSLLRRFVMVCQTVAYAHGRGILHRDLKPANIMLGRFGETLVMDWGLAKPLRGGQLEQSTPGAAAQRQLASPAGLTAAGSVVGTPAYMPPEQALGKAAQLGVASDIYSLGAVLYHLLTGSPPYKGNSSVEVLEMVISSPPPKPSSLVRGAPRALEAICLKAMSRQPKARYRTVSELAESVERWLDDEPVEAYAEPFSERLYRWSRKHKSSVTSGAISLLVVLLVGAIANVVYLRERDKATAAVRMADDYARQAAAADRRATQKEAEARQTAEWAKQQVAATESALAAKTGEIEDLVKKIEAACAELAAAQTQTEAESQRADAASKGAAELGRHAVALRREADEYRPRSQQRR